MNVNLTDGQAHDIAVYALDWPDYGRSEQIQVSTPAREPCWTPRPSRNFNGGLYLQWQITGNVIIQFSGMGGTNAVLSGLFFDPPTPTSDVLNISSPSTTDTAGTAQTFTVTALGPNGQTDTHYTGTIHFTSTDPHALLPANYTFTAADAGVHTFSATLETAGTQSVTATDTTNPSTTGTEPNITVAAAAASSLTLTGFPNPDTAGTAANFTVTAYDPYGNVATGYTGTVHFTSTDPQASLPANYTFTAADAGKHTFSATLKTAGTQSITATDTASASITGTTSATVVSSPSASAALLKLDSTTEGNWIGAYGSQGYNIIGIRRQLPVLRHRQRLRPDVHHLGRQHQRSPRPPDTRRRKPHRRMLVLRHQLHGERQPDRRPGSRRRRLCPRLARLRPLRADPGLKRRHGCGAEHRDHLVVQGGSTSSGRSPAT